jgi:hypothetical protein
MRWIPWLLGIAGVVQYAVIAALQPTDYVSTDMSYLVMWLTVIGGLVVCYLGCYGDCGYGSGGGCGCCGDECGCGDCEDCMPEGSGHDHGHEGHDHGPGEHHAH